MRARRRALWVVVRVAPHMLVGERSLVTFGRWGWSIVHRRHRNVPRELRPA